MTSDFAPALRAALVAADYTYDAVADLLGTTAHAALSRNETVPGLQATRGHTPLETLTRLFLLQTPVSLADAEKALPDLVDPLAAQGILERSVGEVAARLDVRPYAAEDRDLWVVSDLTPGLDGAPNRVGTDHVLGISSASTSLAQLTIREPVARALDLGTGCGVQALHLAEHARSVVATDVNKRALWMTELNAWLNELPGIQVRDGSFFEPVHGEQFDLIATNPPFVISPATGERLVYRDSGLPGDRVVEDIVRAAPAHLTQGGWCQILANWVITDGVPWDERLSGWVTDCDAWVVQREVVDPATYVELWLKDAGVQGTRDYVRRYETWLSWFAEQGVEGVGFGWINLRRTDAEPTVRFEDWPYDVEQPIAPAVHAWGEAIRVVAGLDDDALLGSRLVACDDVQQETLGAPGAEDPHTVVLRQQRGLRRARQVDTVEAALVGACDGDLAVGQILDALAQLTEADAGTIRASYLPVVRDLVGEGFLLR
ncbi:MAG: class I SAM-dependent methyltransferase [Nocardioides sp.]|nr:class I SAM-dependent methyltransferase [Nocardioides sp.]